MSEAPEEKWLAHNGGLPSGNYPQSEMVRYVRADVHEAAVAAARKEGIALRNFVEDFAAAKIDALRHQPAYGESPEDEPDPVVEAETVWAWQADAKDALSEASK